MCAINSVRLAPGSLLPEGFGPAATRRGWHPCLPQPRWATLFALGIAWFAATSFSSAADIITTYASTGAADYTGDGGPATNATLTDPWGLAVDPVGNLYFADFAASVVRRVDYATGLAGHFSKWGVGLSKPVRVETTLLGGSILRLTWPGVAAALLETSTNLGPNSWTPAGSPRQQPDGSWRLEVSPTEPARFYWLRGQ